MSNNNADLYDRLDPLYRALWGESLHHGQWHTGQETALEAPENLARSVLDTLQPEAGQDLADIGCGYGAMSLRLVKNHHCKVTAVTSSKAQAKAIPSHPGLTVLSLNWLDHQSPPDSLDGALAIESLSHFPDFSAFCEATSVPLRPGARFVVADWFAAPGASRSGRFFLNHLAQTGDIPPFRSFRVFSRIARQHSFELTHSQDLSAQVAPTWTALLKKSLLLPLRNPMLILIALRETSRRPALFWAFPLARFLYHIGLLEYHLATFTITRSRSAPHLWLNPPAARS